MRCKHVDDSSRNSSSLRVRLDWTYCYWNWKLKTENWKHYSKIIFKCVKNTVGPIFNIFNAWTVLLQYMNSTATVHEQWFLSLHSKFTVHALKKKRTKTWNENVNVGFSWNQTLTECLVSAETYVHVFIFTFPSFFFFFFLHA